MKKETIKVFYKRPGKNLVEVTIPNELEWIQGAVEGHFEHVQICTDFAMLCNEEGKLLGMEPNFRIGGQYFVGTCFVVGTKDEEFCDCPIDLKTLHMIIPDMWRVNNG